MIDIVMKLLMGANVLEYTFFSNYSLVIMGDGVAIIWVNKAIYEQRLF